MLSEESLQLMRQKLDVYDVAQHGWVHEDMGFNANIAHTVSHLDKSANYKDIVHDGGKSTILGEVMPDSVQYALRLSRWAKFDVALLQPDVETDTIIDDKFARNYPGTRRDIVALNGARAVLNVEILHDTAHPNLEADANSMTRRRKFAAQSGRLLLYSADIQAEHYDADIEQSFDARLAQLRRDNHIPDPENITDVVISKQDFRSIWGQGYGQSWHYVTRLARTEVGFPMSLGVDHEGNEVLAGDILAAYQWIRELDIFPTGQTILKSIASRLRTPDS